MVKQYLLIFALVTIGVIAGAVFSHLRMEPEREATISAPGPTGDAYIANGQENSAGKVAALEAEIASLKRRIEALETAPPGDISTEMVAAVDPGFNTDRAPLFETSDDPVSMTEGLIAAGLDAYSAEQIARKQSAVELRRLELRDSAMRDGTIGSDEYRQQLMALREEEVKVRNEVQPDVYDRYLYHTGQTNRVAVRSIMIGSKAENVGLQNGDVLLSYDGNTIYNYRDLRSATLGGEAAESVNVRVARGGTEMTFSVERGPLGVRLDSMRVNPDEG